MSIDADVVDATRDDLADILAKQGTFLYVDVPKLGLF